MVNCDGARHIGWMERHLAGRRTYPAGRTPYGGGRRPRSAETVGVGNRALARVELLDGVHLACGEVEVQDVEGLLDALRRDRLGDDDVAQLQVPAQDDLRGRLAMCLRQAGDDRVVENPALGERAPGLGDDPEVALAGQAGAAGSARSSSTGLIAGVTPVSSITRRRWAGWKFETPMARTTPSPCSSTNACHVSTYRSRAGTGQWIR